MGAVGQIEKTCVLLNCCVIRAGPPCAPGLLPGKTKNKTHLIGRAATRLAMLVAHPLARAAKR